MYTTPEAEDLRKVADLAWERNDRHRAVYLEIYAEILDALLDDYASDETEDPMLEHELEVAVCATRRALGSTRFLPVFRFDA